MCVSSPTPHRLSSACHGCLGQWWTGGCETSPLLILGEEGSVALGCPLTLSCPPASWLLARLDQLLVGGAVAAGTTLLPGPQPVGAPLLNWSRPCGLSRPLLIPGSFTCPSGNVPQTSRALPPSPLPPIPESRCWGRERRLPYAEPEVLGNHAVNPKTQCSCKSCENHDALSQVCLKGCCAQHQSKRGQHSSPRSQAVGTTGLASV